LTGIIAPLTAFAQGEEEKGIPAKSIATILPEHGDPDGSRKALAASGITYEWNYVGEWQANVAGGLSQGSVYIGRLEGVLNVDLGRRMGWQGLTFHANGFQIHGSGLSREHIGNLMTASYIEALATTRLSEVWLEQKLLGDKLGLRFGQAGGRYGVQHVELCFPVHQQHVRLAGDYGGELAERRTRLPLRDAWRADQARSRQERIPPCRRLRRRSGGSR
jgi:carbohydrate-selective porin OprB